MSNSNNNQINIPQAREAGDLGAQMVKKMFPGRTAKFDRNSRITIGHTQTVQYITVITV